MVVESKISSAFKVTNSIDSFHASGPISVASFNEKTCMVTCTEHRVSFVDLEKGSIIKTLNILEDEEQRISSLTCNKNILFTSLSNNYVESRDIESGEVIKSWKAQSSPVLCMAHHQSADILATGSSDHTIKAWNSSQGFCTHNFKGIHGGVITSLVFGPSRTSPELFSASEDGSIARWNLLDGKGKLLKSHVSSVRSLDINSDGTILISGGRDQLITIWDLQKNRPVRSLPVMESIETVLFVAPMKFISAGENGIVRLWNIESTGCQLQSSKLTTLNHNISSGFFSNGKIFLTTSDFQIFCLNSDNLKVDFSMVGHYGEITDLSFLKNGSIVVSTNDPVLKVYPDMNSLKCLFLTAHTESILAVATFDDWIISGSRDNTAKLWRLTENRFELISSLIGHTDAISSVTVARLKSGKLVIVTASADTTIKLWDVEGDNDSGYIVASRWTIKAHEKDINCVTITPNQKFLISGSQDKLIKVWRIEDGSLAGVMKGHKRGVWSVRCSPFEQVIASSSSDHTIKLWSVSTFECLKTFEGHSNSVLRVIFLRNGTELISSGSDGLIKIWDIKSNSCVRTYDEHLDRIWTLSSDGNFKTLLTGDASGVIKVWSDTTKEEIAEANSSQEQQLIMEQDLSNMVLRKDFKNAIILSIQLEQPFKLFGLLNEYTKGLSLKESVQKIDSLFKFFPVEKIDKILTYIKEWNASFKRAALSQIIFNVIVKMNFDPEDLPSLKDTAKCLLPYTERHFDHAIDLMSNSYMVDFVLSHMDNYMISIKVYCNIISWGKMTKAPVPSHRVPLAPGHTLADWSRFKQSWSNRIPSFYDRCEVGRHNSKEDFWAIIAGRAFDLTAFLDFHPGGYEILKPFAGKDMTSAFSTLKH